MLLTAKAAVSWSTPTLTQPELAARSYTPYGTARPSSLIRKSWTRTSSGLPWGRYSRPLLRKSPAGSFFLVSTEITVTRLIEQVADQGAADLVTLRLQRLRQAAHALAGPPQRRFRIPAARRLDQGFEIGEQRRVLGNRRLAPRSRPPNPFRRLILGQFLQAPPDRARRNPSRHRDRCDPTITRGECLRRRDQATAPFIEKRGHRRKSLSSITPTIYGIQPWL